MKPANLYDPLPHDQTAEALDELLHGKQFRLERIVSHGQATPAGEWYDQPTDEWVVLLTGAAVIRFEDTEEECPMRPGDWLSIVARRRHRVEWTDPAQASVWLALHFSGGEA